MVYENPDQVMIGLEVHVQLNKAATKMFCGCTTQYTDKEANTCLCPGCLALPGTTPVLNENSVNFAIKIGLALNAEIETETDFYMKNYFYPDLGNGYQVTQFDKPIVKNGRIIIEGEDGELLVRIRRAHMEDDPGKLVHMGTIDKSTGTLMDFNRSGMPLVEIVTEPDMRTAKEARRFLEKLRSILEYLEVVDPSLEGAMKADANVSVYHGTRVEVKNISSHKAVEKAINYEIMRQKDMIRKGNKLVQETRHFDEERNITISLRVKETADDYRYFPEPDLVPVAPSREWVEQIRATLPELPAARRRRLLDAWQFSDAEMRDVINAGALDLLESTIAAGTTPGAARKWWMGELSRRAKADENPPGPFTPRAICLNDYLDDFFFTQDYADLMGSSRDSHKGQVVDLNARRKIADLDISGMPHLGSGITWQWQDPQGRMRTVMASTNLHEGMVTVIDMGTWQKIKDIPTPGPGFFIRGHEKSPYVWVDSMMSPQYRNTLTVIDKNTLQVVGSVRADPGQTLAHIEFTKDGRYALASLMEPKGAIIVYDARTLREVKRIPMSKPIGKYNVFNKTTLSSGTSH